MSDRPQPATTTGTLGFLAILHESGGCLGGYLVTNAWGRPLEFRLTTAVHPNKVQHAFYGPTLAEYLHAELIGKTLIEKTSAKADLVIVNTLPALGLRTRLEVPVVGVKLATEAPALMSEVETYTFQHPRSSVPLLLEDRFAIDEAAVRERLEQVDPAVDVAEPFARVLAAIAEHRKTGVANRAA